MGKIKETIAGDDIRNALEFLVAMCERQSSAYNPHCGTHDGRGYTGNEDVDKMDVDGDAPCRICIGVARARSVLNK